MIADVLAEEGGEGGQRASESCPYFSALLFCVLQIEEQRIGVLWFERGKTEDRAAVFVLTYMKLGILFYKFIDNRMLESEEVIPFLNIWWSRGGYGNHTSQLQIVYSVVSMNNPVVITCVSILGSEDIIMGCCYCLQGMTLSYLVIQLSFFR